MKIFVPIIVVALVILVVLIMRGKPRTGSKANRVLTLEQKLDVLASCGLRLADPFKPEDLLTSWGRADYEKPGYDLVLVGLGMTEERPPWRHHCANLWHFDTECIEDHGAYKRIIQRLVEMTQGSLPLDDIRDHVDLEKAEAWFSFTFRDKEIKKKCKVQDDWVDATIFGLFVDLLGKADPGKVFIYYDLGGQDCIIGCVAREELEHLNSQGIKFIPLT
jgi:hypothetical protein